MESRLLCELIDLTHLWGGTSSLASQEWSAGVPPEIDDFETITDFHAYLAQRALRDFDPALPIGEGDRVRYRASKDRSCPDNEFSFIKDAVLREQLRADWQEAQRVFDVQAWKSCLVLCGGILEGMLFDMLRQDKQAAMAVSRELNVKPVSNWSGGP